MSRIEAAADSDVTHLLSKLGQMEKADSDQPKVLQGAEQDKYSSWNLWEDEGAPCKSIRDLQECHRDTSQENTATHCW